MTYAPCGQLYTTTSTHYDYSAFRIRHSAFQRAFPIPHYTSSVARTLTAARGDGAPRALSWAPGSRPWLPQYLGRCIPKTRTLISFVPFVLFMPLWFKTWLKI